MVAERDDAPVHVIDLHCHVLAGVDDGPSDLAGVVALVRAAAAQGTTKMVATSHVSDRYPNSAGELAGARRAAAAALADAGLDVRLAGGAEIAIHTAGMLPDAALKQLRLGDGPYLLLESPLSNATGDFEVVLDRLRDRGHRIVLAHPERCPAFQREPARLERLVRRGAVVSITASALTGRFGDHVRRYALRLLRDGLVHNVASDAHDAQGRDPGILVHLEAATRQLEGLDAMVPWLTEQVPQALLTGRPVESPPLLALRRKRGPRLSWRRR